MSPEQGFLRAIIEAPEDDTARLVFADWLDENGQSERAEFIRTHIELARSDEADPRRAAWLARLHRLQAANGAAWVGFDPKQHPGWERWEWGRGMVESVSVQNLAALPELLERFPIREVVFRVRQMPVGWGVELARSGVLSRLESVAIEEGDSWRERSDVLAAFDSSLPQLRRMRLRKIRLDSDEWDQLLANCSGLRSLESDTDGEWPTPSVLQRRLPDLEQLNLGWSLGSWFDEGELAAFFSGPLLARLVELRLNGIELTDQVPLFPTRLPNLRRLGLAGRSSGSACSGGAGLRALIRSGVLSTVSDLDLSYNGLTPDDLDCLLAPGVAPLRRLRLWGNDKLDGRAAQAIAAASHLQGLVELDLGKCTVEELRPLVASPAASMLRHLSFSCDADHDTILSELAHFPETSSLVSLYVFAFGPPRNSVKPFFASGAVPHLTHLSCDDAYSGVYDMGPWEVEGTGIVWLVNNQRPLWLEAPSSFFGER
ncbi:MAG: hypothetical protein C0467_24285 [Planctomycetaceae bacterium]|nr:hypothetical protein [Planctomycetaceae bacterium]